ncbi:MAG TPA: 50S ribosomal protein L10 [Candidatus Saccharimonadales bacterium]|nr:50S ribosomal protein L10 [Candidatus Saccharimonadales bacterium]
MNKAEKQQEVETLKQAWLGVTTAYLVDYNGLTVAQVSELRRKVREAEASYRVVKNRLAILAARQGPLKGLERHFDGMTAVAWNEAEPVALAKVIHEFTKESSLAFKGGLVDGHTIEAHELEAITKLPTRPELIAIFAGMLRSPMQKFASLLKAPVRDLASVLRQVAEKKES